ncbi:MAG: hypothetical protein JSS53_03080 [Proteobacteria bacterium]|nr:hypothetical protein [Pseudomonadota bacterium]
MKKHWAILTLLLFSSSTFAEGPLSFHIYGVSGKAKNNVEKRLTLATRDLKKDATTEQIQASFNKTPDSVKKALQPYGYFKPIVDAQLIRVGFDWVGEYHIKLGPRLSITHLDFKVTGAGKNNPILKQYIEHFPLAVGQPLSIPKYNKVKQTLFQLAAEQGYIQPQLTKHEVKINLLNKTVDITLHFDTGEQYLYGPIHFNKTPFDPKFLQRFVHIKPGQIYNPSQVTQLENNLNDSQFFQSLRVEPDFKNAKGKEVPIDIQLAPKKSQAYTIGVGYSTDIKLRGVLAWEWRRITSTGHHLQAFIQGSEKDSRLQADYIIPSSKPVTDDYDL